MNSRSLILVVALHALGALAACSEPDFPVYNELDGFRVLAVRATPPELQPGSSTELDALVYDAGATVTRRWSLCPWPSDPNDGYTCVVDQDLWDAAWTDGGLSNPPRLTLGQAEGAALAIPDDLAGLRAVCLALLERIGASATLPPDCQGEWTWTIRLSATADGERIETIKHLPVLLSDKPTQNANPVIGDFTVDVDGESRAAQDVSLPGNRKVDLRIIISGDEAETYTPPLAFGQPASQLAPRREALTFTWFVEAGETDRIRTTFREGVEALSKASKNSWQTPETGKRVALFVVVRDNRGGVDFVSGSALLAN